MRIAVVLLAFIAQGAPRQSPEERLADALKLRELALHDRAEDILRAFLRAAPTDPQMQRWVPDYRAALCEVLLAARKYEDLRVEAEPLRKNAKTRVAGLALLALAAWHSGLISEAEALCNEADKIPADSSSMATLERRRLKMIRGVLGWSRYETDTHIVHYPPGSPIAADLPGFGRKLDFAFDRIRSELDVPSPGRIEAFFFDDQAQADGIIERAIGTSSPALRTYYARADGSAGYLIAEVISFYVANRRQGRPPRLAGLREGFFASHADDPRWDRRREDLPRKLAADGGLDDLAKILAEPGSSAESFAVTGSFVRWLIRTRGRENFRRLWAEYNELTLAGRKPWDEIYSAPLADLEAAWRSSIK